MFHVKHRVEHVRVPWRNGGGVTHEVASAGGNDFDWRVSIAEVATDGPFSSFPGVDRIIMLIDGPWLDLDVAGEPHRLQPFVPFSFDGDATTTCRTPGQTRDLNVMTRRGVFHATMEVIAPGTSNVVAGGEPLLVVGLTGVVTAQEPGVDLTPWDTVMADAGEDLTLAGDGRVAVIRLQRD